MVRWVASCYAPPHRARTRAGDPGCCTRTYSCESTEVCMEASAAQVASIIRFGVFELDARSGELRRSGVPESPGPATESSRVPAGAPRRDRHSRSAAPAPVAGRHVRRLRAGGERGRQAAARNAGRLGGVTALCRDTSPAGVSIHRPRSARRPRSPGTRPFATGSTRQPGGQAVASRYRQDAARRCSTMAARFGRSRSDRFRAVDTRRLAAPRVSGNPCGTVAVGLSDDADRLGGTGRPSHRMVARWRLPGTANSRTTPTSTSSLSDLLKFDASPPMLPSTQRLSGLPTGSGSRTPGQNRRRLARSG